MKSITIATTYLIIAVATSASVYPLRTGVIDLKRGEELYQQRCAACHALTANTPSFGPNLGTIRERANRHFPDLSVEEYILESILKPSAKSTSAASQKMPDSAAGGLNRDQILDIVAYTFSQSGPVDYAFLQSLPVDRQDLVENETAKHLDVRKADRGLQLFLHKYSCIVCHPLDGHSMSSLLAPDLTKAGLHSEEYLRNSILSPDKSVNSAFYQTFLLSDGRTYIGKVVSENADEISLLVTCADRGRYVRTFNKRELEPLDEEDRVAIPYQQSLMPDYSKVITEAELQEILEFLKSLR